MIKVVPRVTRILQCIKTIVRNMYRMFLKNESNYRDLQNGKRCVGSSNLVKLIKKKLILQALIEGIETLLAI